MSVVVDVARAITKSSTIGTLSQLRIVIDFARELLYTFPLMLIGELSEQLTIWQRRPRTRD